MLHILFFQTWLFISLSYSAKVNELIHIVVQCHRFYLISFNKSSGPWRWFDESMLDCCEPLDKVKDNGISFGKVVCLAQCAGAKVEAFRSNLSTINDFRKHVMACTATGDCHLISSYHRGLFKQVNINIASLYCCIASSVPHEDYW